MIRDFRQLLLLPALAAGVLLSGCVSYGYRGGHGDYYYGQPTTEYSYPYGGYYGDYGYGYGSPGYYGASPYWSGFGYYRYYGPRYPVPPGGGHGGGGHGGDGHGGNHGGGQPGNGGHSPPRDRPDRPRPPWRDLGNVPDASSARTPGNRPTVAEPSPREFQPQAQSQAPMRRIEQGPPQRASGKPKRDFGRNPAR